MPCITSHVLLGFILSETITTTIHPWLNHYISINTTILILGYHSTTLLYVFLSFTVLLCVVTTNSLTLIQEHVCPYHYCIQSLQWVLYFGSERTPQTRYWNTSTSSQCYLHGTLTGYPGSQRGHTVYCWTCCPQCLCNGVWCCTWIRRS